MATIRLIEKTSYGSRRYRVEGGPLREDWQRAMREGKEPWCEISTWGEGADEHIVSYGGEVWPTAWPEWFLPIMGPFGRSASGIQITEEGRKALQAVG